MFTLIPTGFDIGTTHEPGFFHEHPCNRDWLIMCFSTPFMYQSGARMYTGNTGDILINPPGAFLKHGPCKDSKTGFKNDWIYVSSTIMDEIIRELRIPVDTAIPTGNPGLMTPYLQTILLETLERKPGYDKKISAVLFNMLVDISRAAVTPPQKYDATLQTFHTLRNALLNNPAHHWTLSEMAGHTGYSTSRFCTLYKKFFSITPQNDLINMRIIKARNLLKYTGNSITCIAEECGFYSVNHFSNAFKKATNLSPIQYRNSN